VTAEHRRPPSVSLSKGGLVHAWLASGEGRGLVISASGDGLTVTAIDGLGGEHVETVGVDEEPSSAAWRAVNKFATT
jgi:hypothetical protein